MRQLQEELDRITAERDRLARMVETQGMGPLRPHL